MRRFSVVISVAVAIILFSILLSVSASCHPLDGTLSAASAIVIDADTGRVIYALNEHEKSGMASTTKIMTSLLLAEYGAPELTVKASKEAVTVEGTAIGLVAGDEISLETLLYGMLLESGNDAANTAAEAVGGTREKFVGLMNRKAELLGMKNTLFVNPSGLTAEGHGSTAYDMAILSAEALRNPVFKTVCSTISKRVSFGTPEYERTFKNHNKLMSYYEGMIGVKTGFTRASGRCLVTAAMRDKVTLIAVTLRDPNDYADHEKLLDYGFSVAERKAFSLDISGVFAKVVGSDKTLLPVKFAFEPEYTALPGDGTIVASVYLEPFSYAPVFENDIVGEAVLKLKDGTVVARIPLLAADEAKMNFTEVVKAPGILGRIKAFFGNLMRNS